MIYTIVVTRDIVANLYSVPVFAQSVGMAVRSFADEVNRADEKNVLYMHASDFELYEVGTFDDTDCSFSVHAPRQISLARDLQRSK